MHVIVPTVVRLRVFPFKSLPSAEVDAAALTHRGGLQGDREFALFDESGYVNGKRNPDVHALRVWFDGGLSSATFISTLTGERFVFDLAGNVHELEAWLAGHFRRRITVRRDRDGGFPDDLDAPGPTVVSTATLAAIATWFPGLTADSVRLRLRTNIEINGVPAFWEDRLFAKAGMVVPFRIGETLLEGTNPCARCVVPSRDPESGAPIAGFAKRVSERRAAMLPPWAERSRFDHFYRLTLNTRPARAHAQVGRTIRTGDALTITSETAERATARPTS